MRSQVMLVRTSDENIYFIFSFHILWVIKLVPCSTIYDSTTSINLDTEINFYLFLLCPLHTAVSDIPINVSYYIRYVS